MKHILKYFFRFFKPSRSLKLSEYIQFNLNKQGAEYKKTNVKTAD